MGAPLSAEEIARREAALGALAKAVAVPVKPVVANIGDIETVLEIVNPQPEPIRLRRAPDHPVVTVTISGAPSSGKSVIAHLIRAALAFEGIATTGPAELRSIDRRRAVRDLIARGLTVVLEARETGDA